MEFVVDLYDLACNRTLMAEMDNTDEPRVHNEIIQRACYHVEDNTSENCNECVEFVLTVFPPPPLK